MTRRSKIARLPKQIRDELNQHLQDGQPAQAILEWVHGYEEVTDMLDEHFEGAAITAQNLSEWRKGGYVDWERAEARAQQVDRWRGMAEHVNEAGGGKAVGDCVATLVAVELAELAETMMEEKGSTEERWERVSRVLKKLSKLRQDDYRARWIRIQEEKWGAQKDVIEGERVKAAKAHEKQQRLAVLEQEKHVGVIGQLEGGTARDYHRAAEMCEVENDLPYGRLHGWRHGVWLWEDDRWEWRPDAGQERNRESVYDLIARKQAEKAAEGKEEGGMQNEEEAEVQKEEEESMTRTRTRTKKGSQSRSIQVNPTKNEEKTGERGTTMVVGEGKNRVEEKEECAVPFS